MILCRKREIRIKSIEYYIDLGKKWISRIFGLDDTLSHIGNENSGRYPRGSGKRPYQHEPKGTGPIPVSMKTSNGISINSVSIHALDQARDRGVSLSDINRAVSNPMHIDDVRTDNTGRRSQRFIGHDATVNVNPDVGTISTVWKTGTRARKKYGNEE